jgi:hypothetical protein
MISTNNWDGWVSTEDQLSYEKALKLLKEEFKQRIKNVQNEH